MNYWPLIGVAVVIAGFATKRNAVLVVVAAGVASALAAGMNVGDLLALLGNAFVSNRALLLFTLTLPVIGLLERYGLRERAKRWIEGFKGLSLARLLIAYLGARQLLAMFGLIDLGGHAQTVRPLLAPMSEAAAARRRVYDSESARDETKDVRETSPPEATGATLSGERTPPADAGAPVPVLPHDELARVPALTSDELARVRALAAATDNVGRFFGEDVFLAFGAVLLIQAFYERNGIHLEPLAIALWALPTAISAFVIHSIRIVFAQRALRAPARRTADPASTPTDSTR